MAYYARDVYIGDGSNINYQVSFNYTLQEEVVALIDGVQLDFNFVSESLVQLSSIPPSGSTVVITRQSDISRAINDYESGSTITETNLSESFDQSLHGLQEISDQWQVQNEKLTEVQAEFEAGIQTVVLKADEAGASATASQTSATASQTSATASQTSATASQTSATASQTSATASQTSATASQTSATAAQTSATASQTSATAAQTSATAAQSIVDGIDYQASTVVFDNSSNGFTSANVQDAIEEAVAQSGTTPAAANVTYDNTTSGLTATNAQAAIDEVATAAASLNESADMVMSGEVAVITGTAKFYPNFDFTFTTVVANVGTAPTGSDLIIVIKKNGSAVHTATISNGSTYVRNLVSIPLVVGDYLTVDVTQVGSTVPSSDLTVKLR